MNDRCKPFGSVYLLSGIILVGDPLFDRKSELLYRQENICSGRWKVSLEGPIDNHSNIEKTIIIQYNDKSTHEPLAVRDMFEIKTLGGYVGVFDETHFQAGNNERCQAWVDYCVRRIHPPYNMGIITCGVAAYIPGENVKCRLISYAGRSGYIYEIKLLLTNE